MGEPVYDQLARGKFKKVANFDGLSRPQKKRLAGNGIHMEVLGSLLLYVLTNVTFVEDSTVEPDMGCFG